MVVGCPELAREILEDVTTTKPDFLYKDAEVLCGGRSNPFTTHNQSNSFA